MSRQNSLSSKALVQSYLDQQPEGLGFVIGYASPQFQSSSNLFWAGNVANQFGQPLKLEGGTPFIIASITKTFTATLYALLIRQYNSAHTLSEYIAPNGPLPISSILGGISLDSLVNYTSGFPEGDNDVPPYLPQPYSLPAMLGYLNAGPPRVDGTGKIYTYSNLAFAIMSAVLRCSAPGAPWELVFTDVMRNTILDPLGMSSSHFFGDTRIQHLPLGYDYNNDSPPAYSKIAPGWDLLPAYNGPGGLVASANDMMRWLLFNMGIVKNSILTPLLPALQTPSTMVEAKFVWGKSQLGLGWFITLSDQNFPSVLWKDGDLGGANSYIAFLNSEDIENTASQAGVFVLVNGSNINGKYRKQEVEVAAAIAWDVLYIMQGRTPPADKSLYPRSAVRRLPPKP